MKLRFSHAALAAAALSAVAAAEPWVPVDTLPGGIAVEMDQATKIKEMDGIRTVERATFRKQLPTGMMETAVEIDCAKEDAKINGIKLTSDGKVLADNVNKLAQFEPINPGSAEAMYFKALCGKEVSGASETSPATPGDKGADATSSGDTGE